MKTTLKKIMVGALLLLVLGTAPVVAEQECYADYKAKRSSDGQISMQLHYGMMALNDAGCLSIDQAETAVSNRLTPQGWSLLRVISIFATEGLEQRRENAGEFYLRF